MAPKIVIAFLFIVFSSAAEAAPVVSTAWDHLKRSRPELAVSATALERLVLERLTPAELESYRGGTPASEIRLLDGKSLEQLLQSTAGGIFDFTWMTLDGGGTTSLGGEFALSGTIGQPDVGTSSGGIFRVTGGFWAVAADPSKLFCDGFETGSTHQWSFVLGE